MRWWQAPNDENVSSLVFLEPRAWAPPLTHSPSGDVTSWPTLIPLRWPAGTGYTSKVQANPTHFSSFTFSFQIHFIADKTFLHYPNKQKKHQRASSHKNTNYVIYVLDFYILESEVSKRQQDDKFSRTAAGSAQLFQSNTLIVLCSLEPCTSIQL